MCRDAAGNVCKRRPFKLALDARPVPFDTSHLCNDWLRRIRTSFKPIRHAFPLQSRDPLWKISERSRSIPGTRWAGPGETIEEP